MEGMKDRMMEGCEKRERKEGNEKRNGICMKLVQHYCTDISPAFGMILSKIFHNK